MNTVCRCTIVFFLSIFLIPLTSSADTGYSVRSDRQGDDFLYSIDLESGLAIPIGPTGFDDIECLTFDIFGNTLYGLDEFESTLVSCDLVSGACEEIVSTDIPLGNTCGMTHDCNGNLLIASTDNLDQTFLYSVNPSTGESTEIGTVGERIEGLSARLGDTDCPSGVYGLASEIQSENGEVSALGCIDLQTGEFVLIGTFDQESNGAGIDFNQSGETLWGLNDGTLELETPDIFIINTETGEATVVSQTLVGFESLAIAPPFCGETPVSQIPTLSEWGLIATAIVLGFAGIMFIYFRRRTALV